MISYAADSDFYGFLWWCDDGCPLMMMMVPYDVDDDFWWLPMNYMIYYDDDDGWWWFPMIPMNCYELWCWLPMMMFSYDDDFLWWLVPMTIS